MIGLNTVLPRGAASPSGIRSRGRVGSYSTGGGVSSLVADHLMPAGAPVEAGVFSLAVGVMAALSLSTPPVLRRRGPFWRCILCSGLLRARGRSRGDAVLRMHRQSGKVTR